MMLICVDNASRLLSLSRIMLAHDKYGVILVNSLLSVPFAFVEETFIEMASYVICICYYSDEKERILRTF